MPELDIELKPSKLLIALMTFLALCGVIAVLMSNFDRWNQSLLILVVIFYYAFILYRYGLLLSPDAIERLVTDGEAWYVVNDEVISSITFLGESTLTQWAYILRYRQDNHRLKRSCIICRDSVEKTQFRRLGVALRCI